MSRFIPFISDLTNFEVADISASLSSSSNVVGDKTATLTITVDPGTQLAGEGTVVLNVPEYYTDAGSDQMIGRSSSCASDGDLVNVSCEFLSASRQLTISYETSNGSATSSSQTFFIYNFKNPVKPTTKTAKTGFTVFSTDSEGYAIGTSEEISLSGITEPTGFNYV